MKLALRQVTVKVKALSGPVHPKKSQRRKEHMKLAMTQVTVKVKALSGSVPYLFIVIRENEILMAVIRVSLFFLFVNRARDPPPPLYDPQKIPDIKISHPNKYKKTDLYTMYCLLYQHFSGAHALLKISE